MPSALLIIDVQNDFLPGSALEVPDSDTMIEVINSIQPQFELVIASQYWHPEHHVSFRPQIMQRFLTRTQGNHEKKSYPSSPNSTA